MDTVAEETILKCVVFDQDCFRDLKMHVADQRKRKWLSEYLPELTEASLLNEIHIREELEKRVNKNVVISASDNEVLRQLSLSNVELLGSTQDGMYLEKPPSIYGDGAYVNESDVDVLFEFSGVDVLQDQEMSGLDKETSVFLTVENTKNPGYIKLKINKNRQNLDHTKPIYFSAKALKHKLYHVLYAAKFYISQNLDQLITESPAIGGCIEDELGIHYLDYVAAMTMPEWPKAAELFLTRERPSGWPNEILIDKIVKGGCGFVGTGHRSRKFDDYQWRISFAKAEQILVHSINDSQLRAYLFFKSIYKIFLSESEDLLSNTMENVRPGGLSSYMMKNVLFWTIEKFPSDQWEPDNIFTCVESLVDMLCVYLQSHFIPNFFLPQQNLIGHLDVSSIDALSNTVKDISENLMERLIYCIKTSEFNGLCEISLPLLHIKFLTEPVDTKHSILSMAYFSMYLFLRLLALRYQLHFPFDTTEKCIDQGVRSISSKIPTRACWFLMKAILLNQDISLLRLTGKSNSDENFQSLVCDLELDISGFRTKIVEFWRTPLYKGIFKRVLDDQEFFSGNSPTCIPEFDQFTDWVDLTCQSYGQKIQFGHKEFPIMLD